MPKVLILIPLFVSARTLARANDLLDALRAHENPRDFEILFVLDGKEQSTFALSESNRQLKVHLTSNPRPQRSNGWSGGLICGLIHGMKTALTLGAWDFIVRMDDDAMVLRPFLARAADYFAEDSRIGQVGFYEFGVPPKPGEYHFFAGPFYRRSKLVRYHPDVGGLWLSLFGWRRSVRLMINEALRHDYACGEFCQGGTFFLSRASVAAMCASRYFKNEKVFAGCTFTEDFFFAIANRAAGFTTRYVSDQEHFLSLKWKGLHKPADQLLSEGYAVVHSVKDDQAPEKEAEVRELFRRERPSYA
jgi:GT2 family glycosyltransferase